MRMSRAAAAESRARIVDEAAKMLRARGVAGASVAEVMQAAGMTHGGFYKHFESKDELLAEAATAAFAEVVGRFDRRAARQGEAKAAAAYVADYLSSVHIAHPERGCPLAAFGAEAARHPDALSRAFTEGVGALVERISRAGASRAEAIRKLTTLLGAVVAARAVGPGPLQQEILAAARGVCDDDAG